MMLWIIAACSLWLTFLGAWFASEWLVVAGPVLLAIGLGISLWDGT